ncbi:hypothetical protein [Natronorarus salvus]|uniref:hypothetical protein n=1 Tax=Natronorarus salvus TaxID=3117733 RepID=UPI002F25F776
MSDDIITTGFEADRYLKARQLAYDFESTLLGTLERTGRTMLRDAEYHTDVAFSDKALGPDYTPHSPRSAPKPHSDTTTIPM